MKITVSRETLTDASTIGRMMINGAFECFTLEDKVREVDGKPVESWKEYGQTAIPKGTYRVIVDWSNRFGKYLPRLLDVPGFEGVRIHPGNTSANTEGCILVGSSVGCDRVNNSRVAFNDLMALIDIAYERKEEITLEIS